MDKVDLQGKLIAERYEVVEPLGEGAMGTVFLGRDVQLRRQVALKILRKEWVSRPEVARRIENECRLMAHLGPHPHIITLFDRLVYNGNTILVMEYVPGETLADALQRTRTINQENESARKTTPLLAGVSTIVLTQQDMVNIVVQCLAALDFAHSKGVIHRDIKPSNIMLSRDHCGNIVAKVMDFGIGKALIDSTDPVIDMTALTLTGAPGPGTPAYMAPEQIDALRYGPITPATDLYAVGVMLFELMTGRLPFQGTYTEILHGHVNVEPPDPRRVCPSVPANVAKVIQRALRKKPAERYTLAAVFRTDLQMCASRGETVLLAPPLQKTQRARPSRYAMRAISALLLLGGLSVATYGAAVYAWPHYVTLRKLNAETATRSAMEAAAKRLELSGISPDTFVPYKNARSLLDKAENAPNNEEARSKFLLAKQQFDSITAPDKAVIEARGASIEAQRAAEQRFITTETEFPTTCDAQTKHEAAEGDFADMRWTEAKAKYDEARRLWEKLMPSRPPELDKARQDAENEKKEAQLRFERAQVEDTFEANAAPIHTLMAEAFAAEQDRKYKSALTKYEEAVRSYRALRPQINQIVLDARNKVLAAKEAAISRFKKANLDIHKNEQYLKLIDTLASIENKELDVGMRTSAEKYSQIAKALGNLRPDTTPAPRPDPVPPAPPSPPQPSPAPDNLSKTADLPPNNHESEARRLRDQAQSAIDRANTAGKFSNAAYQQAARLNTDGKRAFADKRYVEAIKSFSDVIHLLSE